MFQGKRVVIFDMDGMLIDSVGVWNEVDKELVRRIGGGEQDGDALQHQRDEILRRYAADSDPYGKYCQYLKAEYGAEQSAEDIYSLRYSIAQHYLINVVDYKPGAELFLRELRARGFRLSVATTTRRRTVDIYRTRNRNILGKAPIDEFFSPVYAREDVSRMKPDPEVYFRVMSETGAAPEECLIFEDSLIGIESAKNAGIQAAAVYDRYSDGERAEINRLADWHIDDYAQALEMLCSEMA